MWYNALVGQYRGRPNESEHCYMKKSRQHAK